MSKEVVSSINKPTRRESALGKNVSVRDLSTNESIYVSWGIVTNVYYKKGTLDFSTSVINSSGVALEEHSNMTGSARIPVDFWGKNSQGNTFGAYRPVSVGNRILVAYVNGKTAEPVVVGVYPDNESSYEMISPADDATAYEDQTPEVEDNDKAFKNVYPSGNVYYQGGTGKIFQSMGGKSFMYLDGSIMQKSLNRLYDVNSEGVPVENTSSSPNAGAWTLVHEDDIENDTQNTTDDHYTRVYMDYHGNLDVVFTDKSTHNVVSIIEASQAGGITLAKQYDGIEDSNSSIYTKLTVGDKDKTTSIISSDGTKTGTIDVSPDTVSVNGKPIANTQDTADNITNAVSGISKEWTENLANEISKVQDEVQKATQEATDAANNAQQVGNQAAGVAEAAKQAASTAQEIASEAKTAGDAALLKANSAYDTGTQAQRAADNAQAAANSAAAIGNKAQETADNAKTAADSAAAIGNNAQESANSAAAIGNKAQETADNAKTAADSAAAIGNNAQETANSAAAIGNKAQETADSAKTAADSAAAIGNKAQETGDNAKTAADSAAAIGNKAQETADSAKTAASSAADIGNKAQESADSVAAQAKKNTNDIAGLSEDTKDAQQAANSATQQANGAFDKANKALEGIQGISTTKSDKNVDPNRVKGVTISPSSTLTFSDLNTELSDLQVNTVTFQIRVNFNNAKDSNPVLNVNDYAQVEGFLKKINTLDVIPKVLIEPLPIVSSGYVSPKNYTPTDVSSFFDSWTKIVSSVATMVNQYNVYGLYIGYAFDNLESYTDNWTSLISTIKPIFSGQLLYMSSYWTTATWDTNSNNKYQTKLAYPLWGMVDIIAIAPYFEVTDDAEPTASDLEGYFKNVPLYQRGQNIYQEIKNFYDKWKKPILLGDVGIPAYSGAAQAPYNGTTMSSQVVSSSIQESWLEAWYVTFEDLDWFKGINSYCIGNPYDSYNYDSSTSVYAYWKKTFYYEKSVNQSQIVQLDDMLATKVSDKDFTSQTVELSNQISTKVEQNQYDLDMTTKNTGVVDTNRIKGGNLSDKVQGSTSNIIDSINTLKLNSITLPIYVTATDTSDSSPVVSDTDLAGLETSIKAVQANDTNTKIFLEPYPLINKGTSSSSGWEPSSVDTWFTSWTAVMSKISQLAAKYQVYGIYVGSKLDSLESYSSKWDTLITSVRSILSSLDTSTSKNSTRVIYETTHWVTSKDASDTQTAYQNKLNNPLFGYVDVIAIAAYFEVTNKVNPSVQDIKDGIYNVPIHDRGQNIYQEIKSFYDKWNKPIMFGELGIPPYDQSASAPYQANIQSGWKSSDTIQHNWFAAWYEVFAPETWLLGFSVFSVGDSTSTYYVQSGDIASFLSQLNLYQSTVSQSQITQLVDDINFRVQKGDVITQINLDDSGVLIDGAKNHITGETTIDNGIIKTAMIGDAQITDAKIDSLTASKLTAGTIDASVISVTNLNASNITTGTMSASKIVGGDLDFTNIVAKNLTANSITSGTIDFSKITGTNIDATNITTGKMNASLITTGTLDADLMTTGTLDASKVVVANLSASSILTGTLDAGKVTVSNLDASNITTGTMSASKIVGGELDFTNIIAKNLTANSITSGTIDFSKITGTNIDATNITTGKMNASLITTGTLDASKVTVSNLNASNITTGTMSASKIVGGDLDFNNIVVKNLTASLITTGTLDFSKVEGTNIDATNITTGKMNASLITTGTLDADLITTGTLDASKVVVTNLSASSILTGTLDASKVTVSNIDASKIITGTLDGSVINVINLNASNIKTGNLTADLIKTGTFDISKVNVENFSANNIVAGTISGKDLSINLDTGAVNFESGTISGKDLSINLDTGEVNFESGNIKNSANTFEIDVTKGEILSGNNIGVMTINDADISYWKDTNASIWQGQIVLNRIAVGATYPSILLRSSDAIVMDPGNGNSPKDSTSSLTGASYFSGKFTDLATVTKLSEFDRGTNPGGYMYRAYESGTTDVGSDLTHLYINPYASWEVKLPPVYHSTGGNAGSPAFGSKPLVEVYGGGMYLNGSMQIYGSLAVGGAKQSIQPTRDGVRGLYAYETAESYFGDLGDSSTDSTCKVRINIETIFRDTVNTSFPYQVFISSYGKGTLWVSEKHSDYFVVESSLPNIPFGWEVKVRRRGSETDRLPKSDISLKQLQNMDEKHMDSK